MSLVQGTPCHITAMGDEELTEIDPNDTESGINEYIESFLKGDALKGYGRSGGIDFNYVVEDEMINDYRFSNAIRALANANGESETLRAAQLIKNIVGIKLNDAATSLYEYHLDTGGLS